MGLSVTVGSALVVAEAALMVPSRIWDTFRRGGVTEMMKKSHPSDGRRRDAGRAHVDGEQE